MALALEIQELEYLAQVEDAGPSIKASQIDLFNEPVLGKRDDELMTIISGSTLTGEPLQFKARRNQPIEPCRNTKTSTSFYQLLRKIESQVDSGVHQQTVKHNTARHLNEAELWVDKYRPRRFIDLVCADRSNLQVLQWATQWRNHIERSEPPPEAKLLLLSGPPGLGKTTLAHIVAHTAGFEVVEINASDERTGDQVVNKIDAAIRSNSMLPGKRPNLLIIDEIDGAAAGSSDKSLVNHLVKLVASATVTAANEEEGGDGGKKKKRKTMSLKRPIICICNDLYSAALKPLRSIAQIIAMKRPNTSTLSSRLREVCEGEKLKSESKALMELADLMDCDIRASLHALQFIARNNPGPFTAARLAKSLSGLKDANKSTLAVYDSIFHADPRRETDNVLASITAHGEYERLTMGVFELYAKCKFYDDTRLTKVTTALDWLSFSDQCQKFSLDERLSSYQPYALLRTSRLFAAPVNPSIKFPRTDFEQHQKATLNNQILNSYISGLPPRIRAGRSAADLVMERIPVVLNLIAPNLRIVH